MRITFKTSQGSTILVIIACLMAVTSYQPTSAAGPLNVYVVNYPLKYFTERIGGELVRVTFPAPPDVDPAYWIPDIASITGYQQADLIVLNGAAYAKWVGKVSLPRSRVVNTSKKFKDRYISSGSAVTHSHGPKGEHAHEDVAFTTWIDFRQAVQQAEAVAEALGRKRPQYRKVFGQNFAGLVNDLLELDSSIRAIVGRDPARAVVASHPVYDYLARGYGMNIKSVHWEPNELPDHQQWMELQNILKTHPADWMIWEGVPDPKMVSKLESIGMHSTVFDPCANVPEQGNFLTVMQQNVENLDKAYAP